MPKQNLVNFLEYDMSKVLPCLNKKGEKERPNNTINEDIGRAPNWGAFFIHLF